LGFRVIIDRINSAIDSTVGSCGGHLSSIDAFLFSFWQTLLTAFDSGCVLVRADVIFLQIDSVSILLLANATDSGYDPEKLSDTFTNCQKENANTINRRDMISSRTNTHPL